MVSSTIQIIFRPHQRHPTVRQQSLNFTDSRFIAAVVGKKNVKFLNHTGLPLALLA
ncbi:hypothetical protein [Nitrosomonas sp. Is79A3]|uniref:hypothetical protein n=1 Tax=Nitrosomonas sp. (strain Is79A3) TaxID=261292 RepID=UPI0012EA0858